MIILSLLLWRSGQQFVARGWYAASAVLQLLHMAVCLQVGQHLFQLLWGKVKLGVAGGPLLDREFVVGGRHRRHHPALGV